MTPVVLGKLRPLSQISNLNIRKYPHEKKRAKVSNLVIGESRGICLNILNWLRTNEFEIRHLSKNDEVS